MATHDGSRVQRAGDGLMRDVAGFDVETCAV